MLLVACHTAGRVSTLGGSPTLVHSDAELATLPRDKKCRTVVHRDHVHLFSQEAGAGSGLVACAAQVDIPRAMTVLRDYTIYMYAKLWMCTLWHSTPSVQQLP